MSVHSMKSILGEKTLLGMYRDCLKAAPLMNPNVSVNHTAIILILGIMKWLCWIWVFFFSGSTGRCIKQCQDAFQDGVRKDAIRRGGWNKTVQGGNRPHAFQLDGVQGEEPVFGQQGNVRQPCILCPRLVNKRGWGWNRRAGWPDWLRRGI